MIEVEGLKKNYGDKAALNGISFEVAPGEVFGFLGPNGAGKTTTIKILTGQIPPTYGRARIMGHDTTKERRAIQHKVGVVPEQTNLYERLTVTQNLELFCRLYDCDLANVDVYLEAVGLLAERKIQVKKLSRGMKQRVLVARALLHHPTLLFLDEPTSGLDPASADGIHRLLRGLNGEGMTIFLTTHNMEEADKLCHRVAFLNAGTISVIGKPSTLKLQYSERKIRVLVRDNGEVEERVLDTAGEESASLIGEWVREGRLESIHSVEPTLADIFMRVTGRELA
ncbi:MAG: ABC transporter ATP-binding protein [Bacillota bacterium]